MSTVVATTYQDKNGAGHLAAGGFLKADPDSVAFTKTGNDTAEIKAGTTVAFSDGSQVNFDTATAIAMPTLTAGTDYAIWVAPDGTIEADTSFTTAPTAGGRRIGGFHYAPGGNASFSLNAGDGGTTPQINEFSFYDLKWRPSVADPASVSCVSPVWAVVGRMGRNLAHVLSIPLSRLLRLRGMVVAVFAITSFFRECPHRIKRYDY